MFGNYPFEVRSEVVRGLLLLPAVTAQEKAHKITELKKFIADEKELLQRLCEGPRSLALDNVTREIDTLLGNDSRASQLPLPPPLPFFNTQHNDQPSSHSNVERNQL